jgi:hypothetical protein
MPPIRIYNADIHTQVEPSLKLRLRDIADAEGIPLSQVVRQILRAWDRDTVAKGEPAKAVQVS